jgi:hypothetical protein
VFENVKSPAVSINASRGGGILSPDADPDAPPEWRKISSGHVARWHDHRIHFMGTQDPPTVRRAPDKQHVITPEWIVPIRYDTTDINARGDLVWVPGPSPVPWLLLAFATLAVLVVAALLAPARLRTILLVALAGLVVVDLIHGAGIALAGAGPFSSQISRYVTASLFSLLGWAAAVAAFVLVARGSEDGVYLAGFSGIFIALFGGFTDIADLSRSQVPFAWSAGLVRVLVSLTLGLGFGILGLAVLSALRGPRALGARGVAEAGA